MKGNFLKHFKFVEITVPCHPQVLYFLAAKIIYWYVPVDIGFTRCHVFFILYAVCLKNKPEEGWGAPCFLFCFVIPKHIFVGQNSWILK
jgi:hypothetical protein